MCLLLEHFIGIESLLSILIESLQIRDVWSVLQEIWEVLTQLLYQHSELSAPVADVICPFDVVAQELKDAADAVALDG